MSALPLVDCLPDPTAPGRGVLLSRKQGHSHVLPLQAFAAELTITGMHAAWRITQTFVNRSAQPLEAVYIHPLPGRSAVHACTVTLGGRTITADIQERGAARQQYQQAVAAGKRAALLEEDRSEAFTLTIGNVQPGEQATVVVELVGPVAVEGGWAGVRLPLTIAPRYMPGTALGDDVGHGTAGDTDRVPDASRISPPVLLPGCAWPVALHITLALAEAGLPVQALGCSYPVQAAGAGRWTVLPGQRADRDCLLRWRVASDALTTTAVSGPAAGPVDGGGTAVAVTIVPPAVTVAPRPRDVVVVLDRSGSMGGWKMVAARRAAARLVDALDRDDRVAVLAFDDSVEEVPALPGGTSGLVPATDRARFAAVAFLAGVDARGGTEFDPAFARASELLADSASERERIVVLITDGQVGDEDGLLKRHAPLLASTRMLALGIDEAVNEGLLARLVRPGGGWHVCVESEDWLDEVLTMAVHRIVPPVLSRLRLGGAGIDAASQAPLPAPDCFPSRPVTLWATAAAGQTSVTVSGNLPDGSSWSQTVPVIASDSPAIAQCWARARIRDLEDRYAVQADSELAAAILACSLGNRVLSRFTAFIAVDSEITTGGTPRTMVQPLPAPHGWDVREESSAVGAGFGGAVPAPPAAAPMMSMSICAEESDIQIDAAAPGSPMKKPVARKASGMPASRRRGASTDQPPHQPTCNAAAIAALRQALAGLVNDQLATALLLRRAATAILLADLCAFLVQHPAAGDAISARRAALARCAPPATIATVAAESPAVCAALDVLLPLLTHSAGPASAAPAKRKSWWR